MKKYKLTNQDLTTHNGFKWEIGKFAPELEGAGDLCSNKWYHYYHDPLLAVLLNPAHANINNPRGWIVDALGKHKDDNGIKGGCTKMRLVKEIELPIVSKEQRVAFAILCAKEVYKDKEWNLWADNWLSGEDRTADASYAAYSASYAAYAAYAADWTYEKLLSIAKKAMKYK